MLGSFVSQTSLCRWQLPLDSARSVGFRALRTENIAQLGITRPRGDNKYCIVRIIKLIVYSSQEEQCQKQVTETGPREIKAIKQVFLLKIPFV